MRPRLLPLLAGSLALVVASGCISSKRQERASSRIDVGISMLRSGDLPGAVMTLQEATKLDRRNWRAWDKLALAYAGQGAPVEAEEAWVQALRIAPESGEVNNNYGLFLMGQSRLDESITAFETAITDLTYRRPAVPLSNMGMALYLSGDHQRAVKTLDRAIDRAPNLCQAFFHRGLANKALKSEAAALSDFDAAIGICGVDALGAYYQAAPILIASGDLSGGCTYLGTVLLESPNSELGRSARNLHDKSCR